MFSEAQHKVRCFSNDMSRICPEYVPNGVPEVGSLKRQRQRHGHPRGQLKISQNRDRGFRDYGLVQGKVATCMMYSWEPNCTST